MPVIMACIRREALVAARCHQGANACGNLHPHGQMLDMDQLGTRREMDGKSHEQAAREMGCSPLQAAGCGEAEKLC